MSGRSSASRAAFLAPGSMSSNLESTLKHGVDPAPCLERNAGRRRRLGAAAGDLHDLGEVAAHVDEARRVGDVGVAEIEVGFVAVGGKRAGPARKKLLGNALPAGLVVFEYIHGHVAARRAEQPHPRFLLRLAVRLFQDLNRGLIGMNPDMRQQLDLHSLMDLRQPARVHVHHPVRHVLARYRRAARLEVCLYTVERQRHDVLAVDDPGKQRRRRKRAWYRRLRLRCSHDDALALLLSFRGVFGVVGQTTGTVHSSKKSFTLRPLRVAMSVVYALLE